MKSAALLKQALVYFAGLTSVFLASWASAAAFPHGMDFGESPAQIFREMLLALPIYLRWFWPILVILAAVQYLVFRFAGRLALLIFFAFTTIGWFMIDAMLSEAAYSNW
jgi:ABC-type antimicrobial peptide transport system permease subunit